jgi:hypothetical protein
MPKVPPEYQMGEIEDRLLDAEWKCLAKREQLSPQERRCYQNKINAAIHDIFSALSDVKEKQCSQKALEAVALVKIQRLTIDSDQFLKECRRSHENSKKQEAKLDAVSKEIDGAQFDSAPFDIEDLPDFNP